MPSSASISSSAYGDDTACLNVREAGEEVKEKVGPVGLNPGSDISQLSSFRILNFSISHLRGSSHHFKVSLRGLHEEIHEVT